MRPLATGSALRPRATRWVAVLACALGGWLSAAAAAAAAVDTRVLTFNVRYGTAPDGLNSWSYRRSYVVDTVNAFAPDLFGMQEANASQVDYLKTNLPAYSFFGVGKDDGASAGTFTGIMYRTSRYTRVGGGNFWLSETPDVPGSVGWDAAQTRVTTWVKLQDKQDPGLTFVMANNHWDNDGTTARQQSALLVRRRMASIAAGLPLILTGDFNAQQTSAAYRNLVTANTENPEPYFDSYRETHPVTNNAIDGTFHGFTGETDRNRIDYVFHDAGWSVVSGTIDHVSYPDPLVGTRYPSDHFPYEAVLRSTVPEPGGGAVIVAVFAGALACRPRRRRRRAETAAGQ